MSLRAVLTYHSIDGSGSPISTHPAAFASHVRHLASSGVRVVPLDALLAEVRSGDDHGDALALTFDDGFANFGELAAPMLLELGLPGTVFVVSEYAGKTNAWRGRGDPGIPTLPLLGWDAIGRLGEAGIAVGAHTRTHPRLDTISASALTDEMAGCADDIGARTGRRPTAFAYPYGAVSKAAAACARDSFQVAVTTQFRALDRDADLALVPRLDAYYFRERDGLRHWGSPRFRAYIQMRAVGRTVRAAFS